MMLIDPQLVFNHDENDKYKNVINEMDLSYIEK